MSGKIEEESMKKNLIIFSGIILFLSSCQKEYSYEGGPMSNGPGPLSYILEGTADSCFEYVVNGKYIKGQSLSSENTVTLKVTVFDTGLYQIQTSTLDGISFSTSGRFNSTGNQQIILHGTGKPSKPGAYIFTPGNSLSVCSFSIQVTSPDEPASYSLAVNEDGSCSSYAVPGAIYHGVPLNKNIMAVTVDVKSPGDYTVSTNSLNGISFSATGKFTATGLQKVQLTGSGTPKDIGVFTFTPYILIDGQPAGNGCNVQVYIF